MSIAKKPRGFLNEAVWPNRITIRQDAISDSYAVETRPFARGKFATVRRCRHIESGKDYAAKYLRKRRRSEDVRHELIHEALVLAIAEDCERIVSLKEVFETPTEVILVLEMATGGELQHVLDSEDCLPEASCRKLLLQICQGLEFLHRNHIAHLDIKPANLLLSSAFPHGEAKLCDFGISRLILPGEEIHEIAGTPDYIAPEVLQYEPISLATDMWSVGILTYVLLTGHTPFGGDTKQDTFCNITLGELDFPQDLFEDVSPEAIHFITQLVVKDPKKRLTVGDVLRHPWLNSSSPSPMSISVTSLSEGDHNNNIKNNIKNCALIQCETPSTSSMGSCESDNEMDEIKAVPAIIKDHDPSKVEAANCPTSRPPLVPNDSVLLSHSKTAEQVVEIQDSSEEERISVAESAESPAPEEELPSLQSSTSSDSPVPAKKDKECELRAPQPKKVNFTSKAKKSSPTPNRSFQPSPVDYPSSLSPQVSPALRRGCPPRSNKVPPTNVSLTRSCSVSPVRTTAVGKHPLVNSSKSLSSAALQPSKSFKTSAQSENRQSKKLSNPPVNPSPTIKRVPSTALKRPQPSPTPKTSRSSNQNLTSPISASMKTPQSSPRPSLLSPTVSSALKSCAAPLRPVNSPLRSPDTEALNNHRRSLIISTRCKQLGHPNRSNRVSGLGVNIK